MSGIAGIFSRTGQPVQLQTLQAMLAVLAHRGPDAADYWMDAAAGLVHRMLFTTPESLRERQPFFEHGCCITADARIDNREELARILDLDQRALPDTSDSQLILAAYRKWGKECPAWLLGDFAFAIWDAPRRQIFCARDPFGVKPLYYALTNRSFIFGSEIKAILSSNQLPKQINEAWMAKFLIASPELMDKESTFYEGITRLSPAHSLTVTAAAASFDCYWRLDPERETRFSREEDYVEALREEFSRAVRVRLRSAYPVGSTLSGGLDSSSIACTARDLLSAAGQPGLHTFSAVFSDAPEADESTYINAVVAQGGLQPHMLHPDQTSPFVDLERVLRHVDEPFYGTNYFMPWALYRSAQENGVRVLLDGTDGDTTISHGMDYLDMLALQGDWQQFALEANAVTKNFDHPRYATNSMIMYSYAAPRLTDLARKGKWIAFSRGVREVSQLFQVSPRRLALNWGIKPLLPKAALRAVRSLRGGSRKSPPGPSYVAPQFANSLLYQKYLQAEPAPNPPSQQNGRALHYQHLNLGMLPYSLELINRLAAAFSIDVRFPFCDRNLVAFSLSIPPEMKLKGGWSRYILRRAMSGILPEEVQWRGGKISLAKVYPYMLHRYAREYVNDVLENPPAPLERYLNLPAVRAIYQRFLKEKNACDLEWVWHTVVFSVWMKQNSSMAG